MTDKAQKYLDLWREREAAGELNETEESDWAMRLDDVWWELTEDEQNWAEWELREELKRI